MPLCPAVPTRLLAVVALVATSVLVAAPSEAAPAPTSALHQQRLLDDDQVTTPPDPMADVAGGTLVRADQLAMDDVSGAETRSGVTTVPPGTPGAAVDAAEDYRADVNPDYPTVAGRFEDPSTVLRTPGTDTSKDPQRVASLRFGDTGQDTAMLSLVSRFPAAGPDLATLDAGVNGAPRVGNTYVLSPSPTGRQQGVFMAAPRAWSDPVGGPLTGEINPAPAGSDDPPVPHATSQWALVQDPAGSAAVALVNRADGTCLDNFSSDDPGTPVGVYPCNFGPAQLWDIGTDATGGTALISTFSNLYLTATTPTTYVQKPADVFGDQAYRFEAVLEPQGVLPSLGVPQTADASLPFALAAGDLDRTVDATGRYRDESVIAWADSDRLLHVGVVDYSANASHYLFTTTTITTIGAPGFVGSIGLAVGDFDDNVEHQGRIAVTWQDGAGAIHISLLRYDDASAYDETGTGGVGGARSLSLVNGDTGGVLGNQGFPDAASLVGGFTHATAGDFAAPAGPVGQSPAGHDVLAVTWADDNGTGNATQVGNARLGVVSFSANGAKDQASSYPLTGNGLTARVYSGASGSYVRQGIPVAGALLRIDPANDFPLTRRQIVAGWVSQARAVFQSFVVGADTGITPFTVPTYTDDVDGHAESPNGVDTTQPISLAPGGFAGAGDGTTVPVWGVTIAVPYTRPATQGFQEVSRWTLIGNGFGDSHVIPVAQQIGTRTALTAYDATDASVRVGAPQLIVVHGMRNLQALGGEPPVHVDWLPDSSGRGRFVNVNRDGRTVLQFGDAASSTFSSSLQTTVDAQIGTSESASVTVEGTGSIPAVDSVSGSVKVGAAFKYQHDAIASSLSTSTDTINQSLGSITNGDDALLAVTSTVFLYRYPILGGPLQDPDGSTTTAPNCTSACYGYYEVTIPKVTSRTLESGTTDAAYFNPSWQIGNVLTYPTVDQLKPEPDQVNSVTVTPEGGQPRVDTTFYTGTDYTVDTNGQFATLATDDTTTNSSTQQTTSSWNVDGSVDASVSVSVGDPEVDGVKGTLEVTASVNGGKTFSDSTLTSTTNSVSQQFQLTVPALLDPEYRYGAAAGFYYSTGGTGKVVYGTDLTSSRASSWWQRTYAAPDPALNLPQNILPVPQTVDSNGTVQWNTQAEALRIRGFSTLQRSGPNSGTALSPIVSPVTGDRVAFQVPVLNESIGSSVAGGTVDFYAVPYTAGADLATGGFDAVTAPGPQYIGRATLPTIAPQDRASVVSPDWTAPAPPPAADPNKISSQAWRIVVVINRDNGGAGETHPLTGTPCGAITTSDGTGYQWDPLTGSFPVGGIVAPGGTLACGQNNEGYGLLTVQGVAKPSTGVGAAAVTSPDVRPVGATFRTPGGTVYDAATQTPRLTVGARNAGTISVAADAVTRQGQLVDVYDGPPANGKHVATAVVQGATAGQLAVANYSWTPTTAGTHTLYQVLRGDSLNGSSWEQTVQVQVVPAPTVAPDPTPTPDPTTPGDPTGGPAPTGVAQGNGASRLGDTGAPYLGLTLLIGLTLVAAGAAATTAARRRRRSA